MKTVPGRCPFCGRAFAILRVRRGDGVLEERLVCQRCMDLATMKQAMERRLTKEAE